MSISTIRRQVKNVAYNFSDAQVKVREATSNDPWGPSTALMSEIADLTHNPMAFTEIMSIVWKRLNDSGKNWRHVYKSLVLLDFLIKCGHEKVAQQCRENVFTIETLKDFQHVEDNRDQGLNIREKAKQITSLLSDDERLKNERTRFILTRNKFKQNNPGPVGAESRRSNRHHVTDASLDPEYEDARPSTATEEEMQLQIALALSREECEKADEMRKSDDARLQMALEESQKLQDADRLATTKQGTVSSGQLTQSALDDLLSLGVGELVSGNNDQPSSSSAWGMNDPWGAPQASASLNTNDQMFANSMSNNDPWATSTVAQPVAATAPNSDPFASWDAPAPAATTPSTMPTSSSFDLLGGDLLSPTNSLSANINTNNSTNGTRKTPENFLGENSNLVNLDNLLGSGTPSTTGGNPFLTGAAPANANPFAAQQRKSPTLNEMRAAQGQAPPIPSMAPRGTLPQANPFANPF
ncbi:ENTH domain-containing protein [Caenorhabditis elegans]|uniref:ENTH domain-containing protein n=1 Tax=Caenorhabditis elegans TaxID=6239 RepID=Q9BI71_CAEEL|nr:ENTH domain-containing protein [Caenorhabditis elegans]CAC35825.1 ENTH domain-containing protein [Caenorhabditis elegans]|eukprot:NP_510458.1 EPsiN (endocytic protein) homolog [Caenorhabditis elegans]